MKAGRMKCAGHVARMGRIINAHRILIRIPEGKTPLGRHRLNWEAMRLWIGFN
jgi:hypothetical protein